MAKTEYPGVAVITGAGSGKSLYGAIREHG